MNEMLWFILGIVGSIAVILYMVVKKKFFLKVPFFLGIVALFVTGIGLVQMISPEEETHVFASNLDHMKGFDEVQGMTLTMQSKEHEVIQVMHAMSHQKVIAEPKWGAVPLTKANMEVIRDILDANDYPHNVYLKEIIERWLAEDFRKIDEDHNYFWKLQDGTVGKATGILTGKEEKAYIERAYQ